MSSPWFKPLDVDRLAEAEADVDFEVPLAELPRLRSQQPSVEGEARGRLHFERLAGIGVGDLTLTGVAKLVCQRCLEGMEIALESHTRVGLVASEADLNRVPDDLEPVLAPQGRISVGELVEEELLLALPIVPMHTDADACVAAKAAPPEMDERARQETQRPFERLGELLKRNT